MDPLSIAATSLALATGIARTSLALTRFSRDFRGCSEDLDQISNEMQALAAILDPITRSLSPTLPDALVQQIATILTGCVSVVEQIEESVRKYELDKTWTKAKWALFGQDDVHKLYKSLEFYKLALGLGLHTISVTTGQEIKHNTEVIRTQVEEVKLNTDEILARVKSIRHKAAPPRKNKKVEDWIEDMSLLSSYAETTYMATTVDPSEPLPCPSNLNVTPANNATHQTLGMGAEHYFSFPQSPMVTSPRNNVFFPNKPLRASFNGIMDLYEEIMRIVPLMQYDVELVQLCQTRRQKLSLLSRVAMDHTLASIQKHSTTEFLLATITNGADPNFCSRSRDTPLRQAIHYSNAECVFALLRCGADPNLTTPWPSKQQPEERKNHLFHHTSLAYAAWIDEHAVWALVMAGAHVNPPHTAVYCPQCAGEEDKHSCYTPLLCALNPKSFDQVNTQVRIVRFLVANGANTSDTGCSKCSRTHRLHSPISSAIISWSRTNPFAALFLVKLLIESGSRTNFQWLPIQSDTISSQNPFHVAAGSGNDKLLSLLSSQVKPEDSLLWKRAVSCAARSQSWECVKVLMRRPYARVDCLHYLIEDFMQQRQKEEKQVVVNQWVFPTLSIVRFSQAVQMLMRNGVNPSEPVEFSYRKQKILARNRRVTETLSALELIEKAATNMSRSQVGEIFWHFIGPVKH